ncbi:MAG: metallophosphoesterase family protein [Phycisphaerae bacterium]
MWVGILSDSHGDAVITAKAVSLLERHGAEHLFHCGDLCGEQVIDELAGHHCSFVWGNCDAPSPTLRRYVENLDLVWPELPVRVRLAGKQIALYHGHEPGFEAVSEESELDYCFHGHTHQYADYCENGCRFINPGALHRAEFHTVALLDPETGERTFLQVETGEVIPL